MMTYKLLTNKSVSNTSGNVTQYIPGQVVGDDDRLFSAAKNSWTEGVDYLTIKETKGIETLKNFDKVEGKTNDVKRKV